MSYSKSACRGDECRLPPPLLLPMLRRENVGDDGDGDGDGDGTAAPCSMSMLKLRWSCGRRLPLDRDRDRDRDRERDRRRGGEDDGDAANKAAGNSRRNSSSPPPSAWLSEVTARLRAGPTERRRWDDEWASFSIVVTAHKRLATSNSGELSYRPKDQ